MSKPSKNVQRCFSIASCIGSALKACDELPPYYERLNVQVNRAMRVFAAKDNKLYHSISNDVADIWGELAKQNTHIIPEDTIPELVNGFSNLITPKMFKDFLAMPQPEFGNMEMSDEHFRNICTATLNLGESLNKLFKTKSPTLNLPSTKETKVKKVREKIVSKKALKHQEDVLRAKQSKERKQLFLANLGKRARELKEVAC